VEDDNVDVVKGVLGRAKGVFKIILGPIFFVEKFLFRLWLKRFSQGSMADFFHYESPVGDFYFVRKDDWPGEVGGACFNQTEAGNTILTLIIEGQPAEVDNGLTREFDHQLIEKLQPTKIVSVNDYVPSAVNRVDDDLTREFDLKELAKLKKPKLAAGPAADIVSEDAKLINKISLNEGAEHLFEVSSKE
jgi:hypothetical protein